VDEVGVVQQSWDVVIAGGAVMGSAIAYFRRRTECR